MTRAGPPLGRPPVAPRNDSTPSSSPDMTSRSACRCCRTAAVMMDGSAHSLKAAVPTTRVCLAVCGPVVLVNLLIRDPSCDRALVALATPSGDRCWPGCSPCPSVVSSQMRACVQSTSQNLDFPPRGRSRPRRQELIKLCTIASLELLEQGGAHTWRVKALICAPQCNAGPPNSPAPQSPALQQP